MDDSQARSRTTVLIKLLIVVALIGIVLLFLVSSLAQNYERYRGLESGLRSSAPAIVPRYGVNVALDQYKDHALQLKALETLYEAGFRTVRQQVPWREIEVLPGQYEWETCDQIMALAKSYGFQVVVVINTAPSWAQNPWEQDNPHAPPASMDDYARFVRAVAERYGNYIVAYQIWDQPNISPYWGAGSIDPAGYVQMLQLSSVAVRDVDPEALVIAGGLAPNTESGGRNMSDLLFLQEIYRRGAAASFDVLGVRALGFWTGPEDRRVDEQVLNLSRTILLREEMKRQGDRHKPVWAVAFGWCALPEDWGGEISPTGSDVAFVQGERLSWAMERVQREWPWMSLLFVDQGAPDTPAASSQWGYALFEPGGSPTEILYRVINQLAQRNVLYPGWVDEPVMYMVSGANTLSREITFWGTELNLDIAPEGQTGQIVISHDAVIGNTVINLDELSRQSRVTVFRTTRPRLNTVRLIANQEQLDAIIAMRVGSLPNVMDIAWSLLAGGSALILLALVGAGLAKMIPWRDWWAQARRIYSRLSTAIHVVWPLVSLALVAQPVSTMARLAGLVLYGLWALFEEKSALMLCVASIPWAPLHVALGPASFSVTEIALLVAFGAWIWNRLLWKPRLGDTRIGYRLATMDWLIVLFVLLGIVATLGAWYRHVAFRELRLIIIEPAILYGLMRQTDRRTVRRTTYFLLGSGALIALYALARYPTAVGVIEAEGLRRARGIYGSPNNLALMLERLLPLAIALCVWGSGRRQKLTWGVLAAIIGAALLLTYSRGAWLLAIPCAILVLILLQGGKARWWLLGSLILLGGALIPLCQTARFSSLFDMQSGTAFLRIQLWQSSLAMIRDHLWLGVGPDNFLYYYGDYILEGAQADRWLSHPHNILLDFWLRLGVTGPVIVLLMIVSFARGAWKTWHRQTKGHDHILVIGLVACVAGALAHGLIDASYFVAELAYWFMWALAWMTVWTEKQIREQTR